MSVMDAVDELELLLGGRGEDDGCGLSKLNRIALQYNRLHHDVLLIADHPTVMELNHVSIKDLM